MALPKLIKTSYTNIRKDPDTGDYWIDLTVNRHRIRENVGPKLKTAQSRLAKVRTEMEALASKSLAERKARKGRVKEITLEELVNQLRHETEDSLRPRTAARYRVSDRAIIAGLGADTWVGDLVAKSVADFRAARAKTVMAATVNRDMQRLETLLELAVRDKILPYNPIHELAKKRLREPEPRQRVLQPDEARRLRQACTPEAWRVVEFALRTGIRLSQILGLQWSQLYAGHIWLDTSTKTHKKQQVPITAKVQALLLEQRGRNKKYVFPGPSGKNAWNIYNFSEDFWRPALKQAGIEDFRFHDLRHTFASRMRELGADMSEVQELGGWADIGMARKYVKHSKPHMVTAMERMDAEEWGE